MPDIFISDPSEVKTTIENAEAGSRIFLPNQSFEILSTISVPSDVQIEGLANTVIHRSGGVAFDLSGSSNSSVSNLTLDLDHQGGGIRADGATALTIQNIVLLGNMYQAADYADAPNTAIWISNSDGVEVRECSVFNGVGGIYTLDCTNVLIDSNILEHTNFGQMVVSGEHIAVSGNFVSFSGIPNESGTITRQGDSFTSFGANDLHITDNIFLTPKCYQMAFSLGSNSNISISGNILNSGITNAIYFQTDASDIVIEGNTLSNNSGLGVFFTKNASNVTISDNLFVNDGVYFGGLTSNVIVTGNTLNFLSYSWTLPGLVNSQDLLNLPTEGNVIDLLPSVDAGATITTVDVGPFSLVDEITLLPDCSVLASDLISFDACSVDGFQFYDGGTEAFGAYLTVDDVQQGDGLIFVEADRLADVSVAAGTISDIQNLYVRALVGETWSAWDRITISTPGVHAGDDYYLVTQPNEITYEWVPGSDGLDTVGSTSAFYLLGAGVENLHLLTGALQGYGNELNNVIIGNGAENVLAGFDGDDILYGYDGSDLIYGGNGNDKLIGGSNIDSMRGGAGDDLYYVDCPNDICIEYADEGTDMVYSTSSTYTLPFQVENLSLLAGATSGYGNNFDNWIRGNDGSNFIGGGGGNDEIHGGASDDFIWGDAGNDNIFGDSGNDMLYGGDGNDILIGGTGSDIFVEKMGFGSDRILDFEPGIDKIAFERTLFADYASVMNASSQIGSRTVITLDADNFLTLDNLTVSTLNPSDFLLF